ncbi:hypothetical protein [Umezawaea tangerina]|uniref:Uncharacterized protein n=1 Tax=Umezawaea tangerina TaxID=84725 RepID=A0A2T0THQ7_9PSEU|nr:hypothetical protein [Umezawaea tangerina]PRY45141.1 hypothetical protein CLV43_102706 [Umezawaea tangerina]
MEPAAVTQLITVGATLCGVALTLATNAYLDRRKARDAHRLEALKVAADHSKWLRDERVKAYAGLSLAGEEVLQFLRAEVPELLGSGGAGQATADARWRELRTALRKAYNQVSLFGAEGPRTTALEIWRAARDGGNALLRDAAAGSDDLGVRTKEVTSRLGTTGDRFLDACREDVQAAVGFGTAPAALPPAS